MDITTIVVLIGGLLVLSVVGSVIFTKKEQAAALKRQQIASYRMRADEAQDLYDGLQVAGLEKVTYQFLLQRIIANLKAAHNIDPSATGIKNRLNSAQATLSSFDDLTFQVQFPSGMMELQGLIGRLNKLVRYLILLFQNRSLQESQYQIIMPAVQRSLLKFDAEGHIKMGHQAANDGQPGTAKQYYTTAREKLIEFGTEDQYVITQLEKVDELLAGLANKAGDGEGGTYSTETPSGMPLATSDEDIDVGGVPSDSPTQEEINQRTDEDAEFTPKKKW